MKRAKTNNFAKTLTNSNRERSRRKEERYQLIAEIIGSRKLADSYIDYAYRSNWDDR